MIRTPILAALTLFAAAPILPQAATLSAAEAPPRAYAAINPIDWTYRDDDGASRTRQLRFSHNGMMTSFSPDEAAGIMGELATASLASPGEAVTFTLVREAGALACSGRVERAEAASGTCRFEPDKRFTDALTHRGLPPEDSDDVLALALVDARIALVDGLLDQGYRFGDADDLIAVAALDVSPAYAGELRGAGLKVDQLDDLVAARALHIDAAWLGEMAQAGYPRLKFDQAIQMRALGVTPDYAKRMSRVLNALGEIE
uniref:hypothetical protein n=1 Tax=Altererythrobacter segetis TaxID=1104773 RepID=UPI00140742D9|nr:hypothetical protein [Altererythrobacter segetis]